MPSSVAHGLAAAAAAAAWYPRRRPQYLLAMAAVVAIALDIDALGRPFGLGDLESLGGHRALTHSLPFAAFVAALLVALSRRTAGSAPGARLWLCLALAIASHGLLDTLTTYGDGVMLLAPFSSRRFGSAWTPLHGILAEVLWVWVPSGVILLTLRRIRMSAAIGARAGEELNPPAAAGSLVED